VPDEILEDGKNVAAIFDDALEHGAEARLALRFAVPFGEHRGGDGNIAAQLFGFVPTQEEAVEKSGLALGKLKILQDFFYRIGLCSHLERGSLQISAFPSSIRAG